ENQIPDRSVVTTRVGNFSLADRWQASRIKERFQAIVAADRNSSSGDHTLERIAPSKEGLRQSNSLNNSNKTGGGGGNYTALKINAIAF
ncbi:MAG: hypothetical protein WD942_11060, partial [Dehalococcoidia bacterium]